MTVVALTPECGLLFRRAGARILLFSLGTIMISVLRHVFYSSVSLTHKNSG